MGDREKDNTTMNKETPYDPNREKTSTYQYLIEFLKESSGIYLAHHDDADGLTSVAFFLKLYASIKGKPLDDINNSVQLLPINNGPRSFDNQQMEELKTAPDNNIVFLDLSPRNINQLQILIDSGYKIANIDHHSLRKDLPQDLILINPMQIDKKKSKNASTSSVLLDIARYHLDINNKWWNNFVFLAKIGNIGDNKREYILTEKNRNKLLKVAEFLNTVGGTTNNSISYDGKKLILEKLVSILVNSSSPEEFWENLSSHQELKTRFEEINKSVKTELIAIEQKRKSNTSSLTIHHFKNEQFGINETVLKQHLELLDLQEKTKPSTILLIFKDTDKYVVSLYSTDPKITESKNHSCSAICIEIGKKFGLGGGGHKHRAGASLPLDKLNEAIALIKSLFSIVTANHS